MRCETVWVVAAVTCVLLASNQAEPISKAAPKNSLKDDSTKKWWETAVIYQIYPRSFKDSNGDGVGDLKGITEKLQYLKDLGVGAVWLSPIYPSPQVDFGYDISNFVDIDPQYGTMDDFDKLLSTAQSLGLRVILDFVPNHSSDKHEWFIKSVNKEGKYTDYYLWVDAKKAADGTNIPPNNWVSMFSKGQGSAWEWNDKRQQYYLHEYAVQQPDLNYRNPDVVEEMKNAIRFWMKKGVSGLRVDSVTTLFEDAQLRDEVHLPDNQDTDPNDRGYYFHNCTENLPETYDMVTQWRKVLQEFDDDRIMMTEAYATLDQTIAYYGTKDKPGATFSFNFYLITSLGASSKAADFKVTIDSWMQKMDDFHKPNWVIGNHDQFRVASFYRYGPELADGINMISLLLPGTAMTYNGEEIGMDNTFITWERTMDPQAKTYGPQGYLTHSRDLERTPFQWDDSTSAGFSTNATTWLPVNPNYPELNVKAQLAAEHSHLKMYMRLLEARREPAVMSGDYSVTTVDEVIVLKRELKDHDSFMALINVGTEEAKVSLDDLSKSPLTVWTSSVNSALRPGDKMKSSVSLRPKEGVVLTTKASGSASLCATALVSLIVPLLGLRW